MLGRLLFVELEHVAISLSIREGATLYVNVRGEILSVGADAVRVPLAAVDAPETTVFPSGLPTASIPVRGGPSFAGLVQMNPAMRVVRETSSPRVRRGTRGEAVC